MITTISIKIMKASTPRPAIAPGSDNSNFFGGGSVIIQGH